MASLYVTKVDTIVNKEKFRFTNRLCNFFWKNIFHRVIQVIGLSQSLDIKNRNMILIFEDGLVLIFHINKTKILHPCLSKMPANCGLKVETTLTRQNVYSPSQSQWKVIRRKYLLCEKQ